MYKVQVGSSDKWVDRSELRSCQFSPLASYRLGEAFSEIKEKTGVEHYNVKMIVCLPQKEGEEDKEVIIDS